MDPKGTRNLFAASNEPIWISSFTIMVNNRNGMLLLAIKSEHGNLKYRFQYRPSQDLFRFLYSAGEFMFESFNILWLSGPVSISNRFCRFKIIPQILIMIMVTFKHQFYNTMCFPCRIITSMKCRINQLNRVHTFN